jgi:hypothetical protein
LLVVLPEIWYFRFSISRSKWSSQSAISHRMPDRFGPELGELFELRAIWVNVRGRWVVLGPMVLGLNGEAVSRLRGGGGRTQWEEL